MTPLVGLATGVLFLMHQRVWEKASCSKLLTGIDLDSWDSHALQGRDFKHVVTQMMLAAIPPILDCMQMHAGATTHLFIEVWAFASMDLARARAAGHPHAAFGHHHRACCETQTVTVDPAHALCMDTSAMIR